MPPKKGRVEDDEERDGAVDIGDLSDAYGMPIPREVLLVYSIAVQVSPKTPLEAFSALGVRLVGPFEVLKGVLPSGVDLNMHWRYQYDPPEVMTILTDAGTNRPSKHWCYHRDDPEEQPGMVVKGTLDSYEFDICAQTLLQFLVQRCVETKETKLSALLKGAMAEDKQKAVSLGDLKQRRTKKAIAQPLSKLGMSVPFNKRTDVGYRNMSCSVNELKKLILKAMDGTNSKTQADSLASISQFVDIANDECDFGHGLEVGLNYLALVQPGTAQHTEAGRLLDLAYMLLGRDVFQKTAESLLSFRSEKGHPPVSKVYEKSS